MEFLKNLYPLPQIPISHLERRITRDFNHTTPNKTYNLSLPYGADDSIKIKSPFHSRTVRPINCSHNSECEACQKRPSLRGLHNYLRKDATRQNYQSTQKTKYGIDNIIAPWSSEQPLLSLKDKHRRASNKFLQFGLFHNELKALSPKIKASFFKQTKVDCDALETAKYIHRYFITRKQNFSSLCQLLADPQLQDQVKKALFKPQNNKFNTQRIKTLGKQQIKKKRKQNKRHGTQGNQESLTTSQKVLITNEVVKKKKHYRGANRKKTIQMLNKIPDLQQALFGKPNLVFELVLEILSKIQKGNDIGKKNAKNVENLQPFERRKSTNSIEVGLENSASKISSSGQDSQRTHSMKSNHSFKSARKRSNKMLSRTPLQLNVENEKITSDEKDQKVSQRAVSESSESSSRQSKFLEMSQKSKVSIRSGRSSLMRNSATTSLQKLINLEPEDKTKQQKSIKQLSSRSQVSLLSSDSRRSTPSLDPSLIEAVQLIKVPSKRAFDRKKSKFMRDKIKVISYEQQINNIAKKEAKQYLTHEGQAIFKAEARLSQLGLSCLIILQSDSIFQKKKKLRILKELVRKDRNKIEKIVEQEILKYLQVYECYIHMYLRHQKKNATEGDNFEFYMDPEEFSKYLSRNQLIFYDLSPEYYYGQSNQDEQDIILKRMKAAFGNRNMLSEANQKTKEQQRLNETTTNLPPSDLMQVPLPRIGKVVDCFPASKKVEKQRVRASLRTVSWKKTMETIESFRKTIRSRLPEF